MGCRLKKTFPEAGLRPETWYKPSTLAPKVSFREGKKGFKKHVLSLMDSHEKMMNL
jgi:hypothetical protein